MDELSETADSFPRSSTCSPESTRNGNLCRTDQDGPGYGLAGQEAGPQQFLVTCVFRLLQGETRGTCSGTSLE